ncbi:hypothetical protein F2Q69_00030336 [Brassica cretica]|uniref:Uncharacterized protein n=1 Tax=Brassica cretica TaxID=69181 RepID=A0A8S9RR10_BRACR|nr:hypothetical protein F2Q69_00030336 [Brassica cretica]
MRCFSPSPENDSPPCSCSSSPSSHILADVIDCISLGWSRLKATPRFADFVFTPLLSLLSDLVAAFITSCISGLLPFFLSLSGCFSSSPTSLGIGTSYLLAGGCSSGVLGMYFCASW